MNEIRLQCIYPDGTVQFGGVIGAPSEFLLTDAEIEEVAAAIQYMHDNPVVAPVPARLTARQAKLVLLKAGLLDDVDAAVAAADRATQIEWEYATEIQRNWPTLVAMAQALDMSDAQLDDLFIEGARL